jgi:hypothetical protein
MTKQAEKIATDLINKVLLETKGIEETRRISLLESLGSVIESSSSSLTPKEAERVVSHTTGIVNKLRQDFEKLNIESWQH